jgi:hypothetical protein
MFSQDQAYPWMFRRDEIDILEDELEDLYELYHQQGEAPSFESDILHEQLDTEERSDQELSGRLGFDVLEPPPDFMVSSRESSRAPIDPLAVWQQELSHVRAHPLYRQAKAFAALLKPGARHAYEQGGAYANEYFRIYANINLVPLKIFTAMCEELHDDILGLEIAAEEYRLALTYVERILESMSFLTFAFEQGIWIVPGRTLAQQLRVDLQSAIQEVKRRNSRPYG